MPLRMDHVGITVTDLAAASAFFIALGLRVEGDASVAGEWVDRVIGLEGVRSEIVMLATPDARAHIELSQYHSPRSSDDDESPAPNVRGIRHISFEVDDLEATIRRLNEHGGELIGEVQEYEDVYRLCYLRGPDGIVVELAQRIG